MEYEVERNGFASMATSDFHARPHPRPLSVRAHDLCLQSGSYAFTSSITGKPIERASIAELEQFLQTEYPDIILDQAVIEAESKVDRFQIYRMLLLPLERVRQSPKYHPEGDALYHSLQVFDLACDAQPYDEEFLLAALLHDVGKGIDPHDHVAAGLEALGGYITPRTAWLIEHHMEGHALADGTLGAPCAASPGSRRELRRPGATVPMRPPRPPKIGRSLRPRRGASNTSANSPAPAANRFSSRARLIRAPQRRSLAVSRVRSLSLLACPPPVPPPPARPPAPRKILRAGMVGMGMIFDETYRPFFESLHQPRPLRSAQFGGICGVELAAVASRTGHRAEAYRQAAGDRIGPFASYSGRTPSPNCSQHRGTGDADGADSTGVDFVCVATPDNRHFAAARAVLAAGKHVLVEKPSVLSLAELDELDRLARQNGVLAKVVYHKLLDPDHKKLRTLVADGELRHVNNGYCSLLEPKAIGRASSPNGFAAAIRAPTWPCITSS